MRKKTRRSGKPRPDELRKLLVRLRDDLDPLEDLICIVPKGWDLDKLEANCHQAIIGLTKLRALLIARAG